MAFQILLCCWSHALAPVETDERNYQEPNLEISEYKKQGKEISFGGDQQEERKGKSTWRIASLPRTYVSIISASRAMP